MLKTKLTACRYGTTSCVAVLSILVLIAGTPAPAQTSGGTRTWKSADGNYSVEAVIIDRDGDAVRLRKVDGSVISVRVDQLSDGDQQFIESWARLREQASRSRAAVGFAADELGPPTDLLELIDTSRDTLKGNWSMESQGLVTDGEGRSVLQIRHALPEQYRLAFTVQRFRGERGLNISVIVGGKPVMVVIDAWKGSSTGLTLIDEENEQNNVTLYRKKVLSNRYHEVVCTIHRRHVHVACDGKTLVDWCGNPSQLSLFQRYWSDIPTDQIVFGSWGSGFRFSKMTLTPIQQSTYDSLTIGSAKPDPGQAVALIEHPLGTGSGFVASRNLVVTNHHVIDSAYVDDLEIHFPDVDQPLSVERVLFESPERDLAVLLVETDRVPLPVAFDGEFSKGDEVVLHGNPSVGGGIVMRNASVAGKITATVRIEGQDFFQIDASVNPGSSGGPILNDLGQVVGVTAMKATDEGQRMIREGMKRLDDSYRAGIQTEGVAFGIPGRDLVEALETVWQQPAVNGEKTSVLHDARVISRRMAALVRLRMLKALAEVSDSMRRQAAQAQSSGLTDDVVQLLPVNISRQIQTEMQGDEIVALFSLYGEDLDQRMEAITSRSDVAESTKRKLNSLFRHVKSSERFVLRPPTSYRSFSKKFIDLQDDLAQLLNDLRDEGL